MELSFPGLTSRVVGAGWKNMICSKHFVIERAVDFILFF